MHLDHECAFGSWECTSVHLNHGSVPQCTCIMECTEVHSPLGLAVVRAGSKELNHLELM